MLTYHDLKKNALEELQARLDENITTDQFDATEIIHEVTENWIPVYTREILELALSKFDLACSIPDL